MTHFYASKKDHLEAVVNAFIDYNPHLKFTHEIEFNNSMNFLDITLILKNNRIITNWYQKPTCSGRILNFHPNHLVQLKRNIYSN